MKPQPKTWLLALILGLGWLSPADAASNTAAPVAPVDPKVMHALNRLSYGPRPGDVQRVQAMGVKAYIREQLNPEAIAEPAELTRQLQSMKTLNMSPEALLQTFRPGKQQAKPQAKDKQPQAQPQPKPKRPANQVIQEATTARFTRAMHSRRQLQELMVEFWFNHFNVDARKAMLRFWVGAYEQQAIRPYAMGNFRQLLGATARHPAMQVYLDNWQNTAPGSPNAKGRFQGLNENYARELMELHTLGVKGGYTQQDVITLARIFTGWGICRNGQTSPDRSGFCFEPGRHDFSDKVFLGQRIKGSGMAEGEQALDILARSPATARYVSTRLATYFVADQPPPALVDRMAQRFMRSKGEIREVLQTLFDSPEFWQANYYQAKFKTPYRYLISTARATELQLERPQTLQQLLRNWGMPLYEHQAPDGYPLNEAFWLNPNALNQRLNFAIALARGRVPFAKPGTTRVDELALSQTLGHAFSPQTQTAIATSAPELRPAMILGSPEFMRY